MSEFNGDYRGDESQGDWRPEDPQQQQTNDIPSALIKVLSFFFPLVGLILFLVWRDQKPLSAKAAGKWAIIGVVVIVVLYGVLFSAILGSRML